MAGELEAIDGDIKLGTAMNCGATILRLRGSPVPGDRRTLRQVIAGIEQDLRGFQRRHRLQRLVVVNVASTEPLLRLGRDHQSLRQLDACLDADRQQRVRASLLYAYAAANLGLPFIHFTASNAALVPAIEELFAARQVPYMGYDGKTGETLVKSALASMFTYRHLQVLSWQGYNMLGDRDGAVLADRANKQAKVETKDSLLQSILGYPLHTHVGIDYVPSLADLKTAWDFIHFQGFLDYRMSLQFTWQGCDSILAAPIVLDMIRFADLAKRRGESGRLRHLACYFKHPLGVEQQDLHRQWSLLTDYLQRLHQPREASTAPKARRNGP
jgi:myo-inositol-1-phosphate synthase